MRRAIGFYTDERGRRRPITSKSVFFKPKYKYASDKISISDVESARASCEWLLNEFEEAKTKAKKRRLKRFAVLAYTRAKIISRNPRVSPQQREEARRVAEIYKKTYERMVLE